VATEDRSLVWPEGCLASHLPFQRAHEPPCQSAVAWGHGSGRVAAIMATESAPRRLR